MDHVAGSSDHSGVRSIHLGFMRFTSSILRSRRQPFSCFSRAIAPNTSVVCEVDHPIEVIARGEDAAHLVLMLPEPADKIVCHADVKPHRRVRQDVCVVETALAVRCPARSHRTIFPRSVKVCLDAQQGVPIALRSSRLRERSLYGLYPSKMNLARKFPTFSQHIVSSGARVQTPWRSRKSCHPEPPKPRLHAARTPGRHCGGGRSKDLKIRRSRSGVFITIARAG